MNAKNNSLDPWDYSFPSMNLDSDPPGPLLLCLSDRQPAVTRIGSTSRTASNRSGPSSISPAIMAAAYNPAHHSRKPTVTCGNQILPGALYLLLIRLQFSDFPANLAPRRSRLGTPSSGHSTEFDQIRANSTSFSKMEPPSDRPCPPCPRLPGWPGWDASGPLRTPGRTGRISKSKSFETLPATLTIRSANSFVRRFIPLSVIGSCVLTQFPVSPES